MGIADSLGSPSDWFKSEFDVREVHDDYVATNEDDPIGHGTTVLSIAAWNAPKASFSTFQVVEDQEEGGNTGDLINALTDAASAGVDILNLSLGIRHECNGLCSLSREVELAIEVDEICVIAATGNKDDMKSRHGVNCPALLDPVISVAGYIPYCGKDRVVEDSSQWWLEMDGGVVGPYCGQRGCVNGESCEQNSSDEVWGGNVTFHNSFPDVFAPVFDISGNSLDNITFLRGTSFAAPIVSGQMANLVSDVKKAGGDPSPEEIHDAGKAGGEEIEEDGFYKLDCGETWDSLQI